MRLLSFYFCSCHGTKYFNTYKLLASVLKLEYSSEESGVNALRGILHALSSGTILCFSVPFGNPVTVPVSGKVNALVKVVIHFCGFMIHDFPVV